LVDTIVSADITNEIGNARAGRFRSACLVGNRGDAARYRDVHASGSCCRAVSICRRRIRCRSLELQQSVASENDFPIGSGTAAE
jgi:hypothetical protein